MTRDYRTTLRESTPRQRVQTDGSPLVAGYTPGMKTAVSIPDEIFEKVERLAAGEQRSRSEVYSAALREYVARHAPDEVTDAMNRVSSTVRRPVSSATERQDPGPARE